MNNEDGFYDGVKRECAQIDCNGQSKVYYTPVIKLWAKGHRPGSHEPALMKLTALVCANCKIKIKDKEFIAAWFKDDFKNDIAKASKAIGKVPFDWKNARIDWVKF